MEMTCVVISGILFVQTADRLITAEDIVEAFQPEGTRTIELTLAGRDRGWVHVPTAPIKGQTIESLVQCLTEAD